MIKTNLKIIENCLVDRLLIDQQNRCTGVSYIKDGKQDMIHADAGIVICSGAIGSPQILLRSGIGSAELLRDLGIPCRVDLAGVGAEFGCDWRRLFGRA